MKIRKDSEMQTNEKQNLKSMLKLKKCGRIASQD